MLRCMTKGWKLLHTFIVFALVLGFGLVANAGAVTSNHDEKKSYERPAWLDKLENQINYEEMMEGRDGREERLNNTFLKMMERLQGKIKEHATGSINGCPTNF